MPTVKPEGEVNLPDYYVGKKEIGFGIQEAQLAKAHQLNPRAEMAWELMKTISPSAQFLGEPWSSIEPELIARRVFEITDHFLAICHYENLIQVLPNPFEVENENDTGRSKKLHSSFEATNEVLQSKLRKNGE